MPHLTAQTMVHLRTQKSLANCDQEFFTTDCDGTSSHLKGCACRMPATLPSHHLTLTHSALYSRSQTQFQATM